VGEKRGRVFGGQTADRGELFEMVVTTDERNRELIE
jgi:hypothetical protein